jgi:hypothetical protein
MADPAPFRLGVAHELWEPSRTGLPGPLFGMATVGGGVDGPTGTRPRVGDGIHAPLYERRHRWRRPMSDGQGPKVSIACAVSPIPLRIGPILRAIAPPRPCPATSRGRRHGVAATRAQLGDRGRCIAPVPGHWPRAAFAGRVGWPSALGSLPWSADERTMKMRREKVRRVRLAALVRSVGRDASPAVQS